MTTTHSDEVVPPPQDQDRRLHALTWLFVALRQLRSFALPLLVLLFTGRGNRLEFVGLVSVVALAIVGVVQYLTFRFRFGPDGVEIVSGVLQRTRRDIPYERIHNVSVHQSLLHRVFGVAEVRLESAGGKKAEAEMRVLSLADAHAVETLVRSRGRQRLADRSAPAPQLDESTRLLALGPGEIVRLGLISNRGMVLVAAALGALWQAVPGTMAPDDVVRNVYRLITDQAEHHIPAWMVSTSGLVLSAIVAVITILILVRLLSIVLAALQFHGFRLDEVGRQLQIERGLLTRERFHLPRQRIQAWRIQETLLHRWFKRQTLRVDDAGGERGPENRGARELAPVARPDDIQALVRRLLPQAAWPPASWQRLPVATWRRLFVAPTMLVAVLSGAAVWQFGALGLLGFAAVPMLFVRAHAWARHAGFAEVAGGVIAFRHGWLNHAWHFAEVRKLQSLELTETFVDRYCHTATLWLDTAGTGRDRVMHIPYLPRDTARDLHDRLAASLDRRAWPAEAAQS